jgi:hypothetical protein
MSNQVEGLESTPLIIMKLEVYRGIHDIAEFLKVDGRTAQRYLRDGSVPGKKDGTGTWVLVNLDYYQSLQG